MYSVLWYKNNPLLDTYREKQIVTLQQKLWEVLWDTGLLQQFSKLWEDIQRDFLTHPDQSSILLSDSFIEKRELYRSRLIWEMRKLISWDEKALIMNSGYLISGTNIRLSVDDHNPCNSYDAHPDSSWDESGWKLWWWSQSPEEWKKVYDNTFHILRQADEWCFFELCSMIQKIVPFGTAKNIHYSASYKECVGTLYMGFTLDTDIPELHVLEGLIHESSHNKLNLIMQYEDITLNDFQEKYYSPYRPDARHIYGVFLGIHALIPTVYVLLKAIEKGLISDKRWQEKIIMYHIKNKLWIATIKKFGILSPMWQRVFSELISVAQVSDILAKDCIKKYSLPLWDIQKRVKEHFSQVSQNYPHMIY